MKNNLKSKFTAFIATVVLLLTGCNGVNIPGKTGVNIKRLSASVYDTTEVVKPVSRKNAIDIKYANEEGDSGTVLEVGEESSANYILIYKDENNIQLTVQLDNPKGESIDALEIACDDENAEILVDNEYKPLNVTANGRVVNWAQEDPYEKTFYLRTISQDDLNTFRVNDIKVNGAWQNKGLDNNELSVYKITKEDLDVRFITNTTEYYECEFIYGEKVSNLNVTASIPEALTWINTSRVRVTQNCTLNWSYDFTFDGVVRHWKENIGIELFTYITGDNSIGYEAPSELNEDLGYFYIYTNLFDISGTNINRDRVDIYINNNPYFIYRGLDGASYNSFSGSTISGEECKIYEDPKTFNSIILDIGNKLYTLTLSSGTLSPAI